MLMKYVKVTIIPDYLSQFLPKPDRTGFGHKFGRASEKRSENWAGQTDFGNLSGLSNAK
jgi:hypothetical protein